MNSYIIIIVILMTQTWDPWTKIQQGKQEKKKSFLPGSSFLPFRNIDSAFPGVYYNFQ